MDGKALRSKPSAIWVHRTLARPMLAGELDKARDSVGELLEIIEKSGFRTSARPWPS